MKKQKLYYLTRQSGFLWKSGLILGLVMVCIGFVVSFFNTDRSAAFRLTQQFLFSEEGEFGDSPVRDFSDSINTVMKKLFENDAAFVDKLEQMQFLLYLTDKSDGLVFPVKPDADNLSLDEHKVAEAFFNDCLLLSEDEPAANTNSVLHQLAKADPPLAYANYALALIYEDMEAPEEVVSLLKREADFYGGDKVRRRLIDTYLGEKMFDEIEGLLADPEYAPLITSRDREEVALAAMDWPALIKHRLPAAYEDTKLAMLFLALASGLVWATILLRFNGPLSFRVPAVHLAIPALLLGALSTQATILVIFLEEHQFGLAIGDSLFSQVFYCVMGIGLREEALKLLFFVPLIPFLLRRKNDLETFVVAGLVGLGFAIEENINYFESMAGLSALGRFATANFLHISLTALCGLSLTRAFTDKRASFSQAVITFAAAVAAHGLYDAFLIVPVLRDYAMFSSTIFILIGYQYFEWLRYLRDGWHDTISITSHFTLGMVFVAGLSFILYAWQAGAGLAVQSIGSELIGLGIILILYYREIPETIE